MTPLDQVVSAKVVAASQCAVSDQTIYSIQARYPRLIHAEIMTHRKFSRNASSSRAIPVASMLVRDEPYVPLFKKNKSGMQAGEPLRPEEQAEAESIWLEMAEACRKGCAKLGSKDGLNVHKEHSNRALEWFGYITVLITSTQWSNFDALRDDHEAQPEARLLAQAMMKVRRETKIQLLKYGEWHLPYVTEEDRFLVERMVRAGAFSDPACQVLGSMRGQRVHGESMENQLLIAIAAARACRVSYDRLDGSKTTLDADFTRFIQLAESRLLHASPFEHQARPFRQFGVLADRPEDQGNFEGFVQFRKLMPRECL